MMYKGCSNLVFQPARTLVAIAAFNKEVLVLKLSPFTPNVKQKGRKNCVWENASKQVKTRNFNMKVSAGLKAWRKY